ncbi:MAG: hypothetical protein QOJ89_3097 [bacterium]
MPDRWRLRLRPHGRRLELALSAGLVGAAVVEQLARSDSEHSPRAVAWVLALAATLLLRRSRPVAAAAVAALFIVAWPLATFPALLEFILPVVLAYSCGAHARMATGLAATVALIVAIQIHLGLDDAPNLEIAITTLPPWWGGLEVRRRRELVRDLLLRTRELEAEDEAFVRLSVQRERSRIARDLHDIVSHHLAVMVIQAGAGRLAEPWDAAVAARRLDGIRDAGAQALAEADQLVTILQAERSTAPRLSELLEQARAGGAHVVVTPPGVELEPEIEAIAYRVAQEALTNAMKHAPGAALDVQVARTAGELTVTVRNDAVAEPSTIAGTGSGSGLAGMRERLAALGGSLAVGPDAEGGFRLCARLPLDSSGAAAALTSAAATAAGP